MTPRIAGLSLLLALAAVIAYAPSLSAPFLSDDYIHLTSASVETGSALIHRILLTHPAAGDLFFRPAGSIYYWLVFKVAAFHPLPWHAGSVAIHAANTVLVFLLSLRLCQRTVPCLTAAALFAWQGVHVEDVCWLAAIFDLLAAFFVLLVLVLVTQTRPRQALVVASSALACLSKEAAYCLPLLVVCVSLFLEGAERRRALRRAIPVTIACGCVFVYRLWFLQGVGGYRTMSGSSLLLTLRPLSVLQALALRIWGILFMPVNWSQKPDAWLAIAATAMLLSLAVLAVGGRRVSRPNLFPAILFVLLASLPALPLLLIGSDLAGARVLYLPSIGISLFWMLVVRSVKHPPPPARVPTSVLSAAVPIGGIAAQPANLGKGGAIRKTGVSGHGALPAPISAHRRLGRKIAGHSPGSLLF